MVNNVFIKYGSSIYDFPFWLQYILGHHNFKFKQYLVWLRITDQGPIPEMCIWFILLIKSDFKMVYSSEEKSFLYLRGNGTRCTNCLANSAIKLGHVSELSILALLSLGTLFNRVVWQPFQANMVGAKSDNYFPAKRVTLFGELQRPLSHWKTSITKLSVCVPDETTPTLYPSCWRNTLVALVFRNRQTWMANRQMPYKMEKDLKQNVISQKLIH